MWFRPTDMMISKYIDPPLKIKYNINRHAIFSHTHIYILRTYVLTYTDRNKIHTRYRHVRTRKDMSVSKNHHTRKKVAICNFICYVS